MRYLILTTSLLSVVACMMPFFEASAMRGEEDAQREANRLARREARHARHHLHSTEVPGEVSPKEGRYNPFSEVLPSTAPPPLTAEQQERLARARQVAKRLTEEFLAAQSAQVNSTSAASSSSLTPEKLMSPISTSVICSDRSRDPRRRPLKVEIEAVEVEMVETAPVSPQPQASTDFFTTPAAKLLNALLKCAASLSGGSASQTLELPGSGGEEQRKNSAPMATDSNISDPSSAVEVSPSSHDTVMEEDGEIVEVTRAPAMQDRASLPQPVMKMIQSYLSANDFQQLWRVSQQFGKYADQAFARAQEMHWHVDANVLMHGVKTFMDAVPQIRQLHCHVEPGDFRGIFQSLAVLQRSGGIPRLRHLTVSFPDAPERMLENSQALTQPTTIPAGVTEFTLDGAFTLRAVIDFWRMHAYGAHAHPVAQYQYGDMLLVGNKHAPRDVPQGRSLLAAAAAGGYARAKFRVARMVQSGDFSEVSRERAVQYLEELAAQGHLEAQYYLGQALYKGFGVPVIDPARAVILWEPLAAAGNGGASYWLSDAYWNGKGVVPNRETAMHHLMDAVAKNYIFAGQRLSRISAAWSGESASSQSQVSPPKGDSAPNSSATL